MVEVVTTMVVSFFTPTSALTNANSFNFSLTQIAAVLAAVAIVDTATTITTIDDRKAAVAATTTKCVEVVTTTMVSWNAIESEY